MGLGPRIAQDYGGLGRGTHTEQGGTELQAGPGPPNPTSEAWKDSGWQEGQVHFWRSSTGHGPEPLSALMIPRHWVTRLLHPLLPEDIYVLRTNTVGMEGQWQVQHRTYRQPSGIRVILSCCHRPVRLIYLYDGDTQGAGQSQPTQPTRGICGWMLSEHVEEPSHFPQGPCPGRTGSPVPKLSVSRICSLACLAH